MYLLKPPKDIKVGSVGEKISLPWEWCDGEKHVKFSVSDLGCTMHGNETVYLNGRPYDFSAGPKLLSHNKCLVWAGQQLIFKDPSGHRGRKKKLYSRERTRSKIFATKNTKLKQERYKKEFCDFVNKYRKRDYLDLLKLLVYFLRNSLAVDQAIIFRRTGKYLWAPIFAKTIDGFEPPHAVLDRVFLRQEAYFLQTRKVDPASRSQSLKRYHIETAFCVPFYVEPFLTFYGDSLREELTEDAYLIAEYLIQYTGNHLKDFFKGEVPPLNTLEI